MIRDITEEDADRICDIYNYYIVNTTITFEETMVTGNEMKKRIADITQELPWIVYEEQGRISGYAYAGKWKMRSAYRYSVETSVYLDHEKRGGGIGSLLYEELIRRLRALNIHAVIGGVALPNDKSQRLHEKFGFTRIARFSEVGRKFDKWLDVAYWELKLGDNQ